jgi:hypothetical protein
MSPMELVFTSTVTVVPEAIMMTSFVAGTPVGVQVDELLHRPEARLVRV